MSIPSSRAFWMMARTDNASFLVFNVMRRSATSGGSRRGATVGAGLGVECLEAAAPVVGDPVPHRLGGDAGSSGPGDRVGLLALARLIADGARCAHRQMHQIGDDAVSEERDLLAKVVV